jgi:hypothetical protein
VVRLVPLEESVPTGDGPRRLPYREQLREDLTDPARAVMASLRLEALGTDSIPTLERALKTSPHPLVRFCAAEALAYLGNSACGEELAKTVREQPYLRAFALTAMASLDEAVCREKLKELMDTGKDDEIRYGAFRALRALDELDSAVQGEHLADTFWLHEVPTEGKPLVHLSMGKRAEIVLFGKGVKLVPPFTVVAGEFAVTAAEGDQLCTISYVPLHGGGGGPAHARFPLDLAKVIRTLAEQGASYPEVVEVIRQASNCQGMSCRVRADALPQAVSVQQLVLAGLEEKLKKNELKNGPQEEGQGEDVTHVQIIKPDVNLGTTPTLYQKDVVRRRSLINEDARALQREKKGGEPKQTAERKGP